MVTGKYARKVSPATRVACVLLAGADRGREVGPPAECGGVARGDPAQRPTAIMAAMVATERVIEGKRA